MRNKIEKNRISEWRYLAPALFLAGMLLFVLLTIILCPSARAAVPRIEPYVNDFANVLTESQKLQLNQYLDQFEKNTSYEIAVVTVTDMEGDNSVHYANMIGDENGVGKKGQDNGIVILLMPGKEYHYAIATGRGTESIINDAKAGRIGRANEVYFDAGNYYEGLYQIVMNVTYSIENSSYNPQVQELSVSSNDILGSEGIIVIFIIVLVIIILIAAAGGWLSSDDSGGGYSSGGGWSGGGGGGYSGGFSGGGGGGGFGGGGFGGGGAGR